MMTDQLPNYVKENYAKAVKLDLGTWLLSNPLPALCERKYDGIRVFLFKSGEKLVLSSKHGGIYTPRGTPKVFSKVPEFLHAPHRMILDGEYVRARGRAVLLQEAGSSSSTSSRWTTATYAQSPSRRGKRCSREILEGTGLEVPYELAGTAQEIIAAKDQAIKDGAEGILVKNPSRRIRAAKVVAEAEEVRHPGLLRHRLRGHPGDPEDGHPAVVVGRRLRRGGAPRRPRVRSGSLVEKVDPRQVKKGSVVEVRFQEVTRDRKLRAPFILRVRHDKAPEECLLSQLEL